MNPKEIDALFGQTLAFDYDSEYSWGAVNKLRGIGTRDIFDKSAAWCASDNPDKRARGADILGQLGISETQRKHPFANESYAILSRLLEHEKETRPRAAAIASLGHLHNPAAVPLIIKFATDPGQNVRFSLAFALGSFANEPLAITALLQLMQDKDDDVRNWATFSLGVQGDKDSAEIRDALALVLNDSSEEARLEAIVGLAKRKDRRVLPVLLSGLAKPKISVGEIEAACLMLDMNEDRRDWKPDDYALALRERFGETIQVH